VEVSIGSLLSISGIPERRPMNRFVHALGIDSFGPSSRTNYNVFNLSYY
jgi:hypothetical protein